MTTQSPTAKKRETSDLDAALAAGEPVSAPAEPVVAPVAASVADAPEAVATPTPPAASTEDGVAATAGKSIRVVIPVPTDARSRAGAPEAPRSTGQAHEHLARPPGVRSSDEPVRAPKSEAEAAVAASAEARAVPAKPGRVAALVDQALDGVNRPFGWLSSRARRLIGIVSLVTIAVSLAALVAAPLLRSGPDPLKFLQERRAALDTPPAAAEKPAAAARH